MVAGRLSTVLDRIAAAAERAGRDPDEVRLVAVSKGHGVDAIREAYEAGHRDFGENRAGELVAKAPLLPPDVRWHFVGSLQSRKAKLVRPHVSLLHSLDRSSLVRSWSTLPGIPPPVLVQVNLAAEPQKAGVDPVGVSVLLDEAASAGISCEGLMIIPPAPDTPESSRPWFRALAALRDSLKPSYPGLDQLSMGMTDDFGVAVEEGATLVRVGRAIFGERTGDGR